MTQLVQDSGKFAVIELEKEIEVSSTEAAIVTVTGIFETKAEAKVEILVNKNVVAELLPAGATPATELSTAFVVEPGHKYEVKKATKLKEAKASIAPVNSALVASLEEETGVIESTVEALESNVTEPGKYIKAEQEKARKEYQEKTTALAKANAEILSL